MTTEEPEQIQAAVRERYAEAARCAEDRGRPAGSTPGLIGSSLYGDDDASALPDAALAASLGCANPTQLADLRRGDVVLDLGSGGGIDVLLSARRVGPTGKAYGLDMTPEMTELARRNQAEAGVANAEFLQGTIEDVPLPDRSVDVIISNCVINLSANKDAVFSEAFRVLKPGGRLAISDIVLRRQLPEPIRHLVGLWTGCVAGALLDTSYRDKLLAAGFSDIDIEATHIYERVDLSHLAADMLSGIEVSDDIDIDATIEDLSGTVMSAFVRARKPTTGDTAI